MNKHIIYLAAGNSRRFGENKLLYCFDGKPLYRYGLDMLQEVCRKREDCMLYVVSQYEEILQYASEQKIMAVNSPQSKEGMSYTIKAAIKALENIQEEDFLIFVVADQPYLKAETLECLLDRATGDVETISLSYRGTPGNPAVFAACLIPELLGLKGDEGGRKVIRNHTCIYVEAAEEKELRDVDTPKILKEHL